MSKPIVSKIYCSSTQVMLVVRRRPHVINGGGLVVTDCNQKVVFRIDGCGTLGTAGEVIVSDVHGDPLLLVRREAGGILRALRIHKKWKGYTFDYEGSQKLVFSLKEPQSFIARNNPIRISLEPRKSKNHWDFEVKGSFPDRACSIVDSSGNAVAQIGVRKEVDEIMENKDIYHVIVKAGTDQAFVFGVVAVLDNIHGESTAC